MSERWVALAQLLRPQGRKGEILAELLTDFPERVAGRDGLYLAKAGFAGEVSDARACRVNESWLPKGKNEGRIVLAIEGVGTIEGAEALAGYELLIERDKRAPLEDGAAYISDLVGSAVLDGTTAVGVVREVQFPASADGRRRLEEASPLLFVDRPGDGGEVIIPFAKAFLVEVDAEAKVLRMRLPKGLVELSEPGNAESAEQGTPAPAETENDR